MGARLEEWCAVVSAKRVQCPLESRLAGGVACPLLLQTVDALLQRTLATGSPGKEGVVK
jgi:hypothetical protein